MFHVPICICCLSFFASHAVTIQPPRKAWFCLPYTLPSVSSGRPWDPPEPSLLLCKQAQLSASPHIPYAPASSYLGEPSLHSDVSITFLEERAQNWTWFSKFGLTTAEQRGRIGSLGLQATVLLTQPNIDLPFFAAKAHWWANSCLVNHQESQVIFCNADSCRVSPQPIPPTTDYCVPDEEVCSCLCWISQGSC